MHIFGMCTELRAGAAGASAPPHLGTRKVGKGNVPPGMLISYIPPSISIDLLSLVILWRVFQCHPPTPFPNFSPRSTYPSTGLSSDRLIRLTSNRLFHLTSDRLIHLSPGQLIHLSTGPPVHLTPDTP